MRFERLTLMNFCKHRNSQFDFPTGLIGIIGANGSGKSNILDGIRFALTGENPYSGNKIANICDRAPLTEKSYVELIFTHGAVRATVRRNLRPARPTATLAIDGGRYVEGDTEVTAQIEQLLGVTCDVLNDIVIVAQTEIFGFLDKSPAKRAELFQRLFQTEKASTLYKLLSDQLKTVEIPVCGVSRDWCVSQLSEGQTAVETLTAQLLQIAAYQQLQEQRDAYLAVITQHTERDRLQAQVTQLSRQATELAANCQTTRAALTQAQSDQTIVTDAANGNADAADSARAKLTTLATNRKIELQRAAAINHLNDCTMRVMAEQQPAEKPVDYIPDLPAAVLHKEELDYEQRRLKHLLNSISGNTAECPTCFTPTTVLAGRLEEAKIRYAALTTEFSRLSAAIEQSTAYNNNESARTSRLSHLNSSLTTAQRTLNEIPVVNSEDVDEQALQKVVLAAKTYADGLEELNRFVFDLSTNLARQEGQLATLQQHLQTTEQQLQLIPVRTVNDVQLATSGITACDQATSQRRQMETELAINQTKVRHATEQLAKVDEITVVAESRRAWHVFAQSMRDVLHKDAAPRFVSQRNLQRLQNSMNENLEMFDAAYRVQAAEGLSFDALFVDGTKQPGERLSEGQQVILALTFRISLNLMLAENIGALHLDEPTAWLDEHHIRGFEPILNRLREFTSSRGLQSIIITHERSLAPLFDTVIQL